MSVHTHTVSYPPPPDIFPFLLFICLDAAVKTENSISYIFSGFGWPAVMKELIILPIRFFLFGFILGTLCLLDNYEILLDRGRRPCHYCST
ncbi:hypothetical protein TNCT_481121 [Trichonephila clavata]|uniref:Uncharacterized protein n=1 Tax=Trichonephila clavata TaxID=2740835 RepID=A0A8X6JPJ6_TRICU|nr:hypothetical protein TNCT_481121 [Trichonephila clavata]